MKEVRAKLEEAPARICGAVLFAVLAVLNRDSVFHMLLCAGGSLVWLLSFFYSYLRYKRWKIEITEKDVIYTNTFGKNTYFESVMSDGKSLRPSITGKYIYCFTTIR